MPSIPSKPRSSSCSELSDKSYRNYRIFIGYHGTNKESAEDLVNNGLREEKAGTGQGLARGPGFYIAREYSKADEYAEQSTMDWIEEDPNGLPLRVAISQMKTNNAGIRAIVAVYTNKVLNNTVDYYDGECYIKQGLICSDGDPHGDAKVIRNPKLKPLPASELELVIRPNDYNAIWFEYVDKNFETSLKGNFISHEDPF